MQNNERRRQGEDVHLSNVKRVHDVAIDAASFNCILFGIMSMFIEVS